MDNVIDKLNYLLETKELIAQAIEDQGVFVFSFTPFREYPSLILDINGNNGASLSDSGFTGDGTIAGKLRYLEETKDLIRQAIELKGVTVPYFYPFRDYADLIASISSGSGGGEGGGDVDDGLVDYNGVMLPDVSPYITDTYPDAAILKIGNIYNLVVLGGTWQIVGEIGYLSTCVCSTSITYTLTPGSTSWTKQTEDHSAEFGTITFTDNMTSVIWSNFEISPGFEKPGHDPGGDDEKTPIAYLYNGIRLPQLPEYDWEKFPYVYISETTRFGDSDEYRVIYLWSKPGIFDEASGSVYFSGGVRTEGQIWEPFTKWRDVGKYESTSHSNGFPPIWANYDILNEDGSVYLAASNPIPVYE